MQGKPELPEDLDARRTAAGSSAPSPGLGALDQAREASLADEGGSSGARIESQDLETLRRIASELPVAHIQPLSQPCPPRSGLSGTAMVAAAAVGVGLLGCAVLYHRSR
jgi:hypothetical protein